jgi:hypothetical protein
MSDHTSDRPFTEARFARVPALPSYAGQAPGLVALRTRPRGTSGAWSIVDTIAVPAAPDAMVATHTQVERHAQRLADQRPDLEVDLVRVSL